ncbi:uncharacterized protein LOC143078614 [Mytilus galloprovincialis]|uniref:uncharacterized protein LOC143078614 n=1 Tax=Mytilus galloprovincialis TaxID=29158 RepID=UPI003F7BF911
MGLTCYANGIFQILAQTKPFMTTLINLDMRHMPLTYALVSVLEGINEPSHQSKCLTVDRTIVQQLLEIIAEDSCFSRYRQDDCLEFLMYLLEKLKTECGKF